jgi:hypothetical protein
MGEEGYSYEKISDGHWRRTRPDGNVTDFHSRWRRVWVVLTDLVVSRGITITIAGVGGLDDEPDGYSGFHQVSAKGELDNVKLRYLDRREGDPWGFTACEVSLFSRQASGSNGATSVEPLSQTQIGCLHPEDGEPPPHGRGPYLDIDLAVPADLWPVLSDALMGGMPPSAVRASFWVNVFEEPIQASLSSPGDLLTFEVERDKTIKAYLSTISLSIAPVLSSGFVQPCEEDRDPPAPSPVAQPSAPRAASTIARGLNWCAAALLLIALILLAK